MNISEIENMASFMRRKIIDISYECGVTAHLGGGLSMVDIMAVLYGHILRFDKKDPRWEDRDRFILSKGHGVLGYYPALLAAGIISEEVFKTFKANGSDLIAHPVMNLDLGIESSNGSLGQGLSMGIGIALAARRKTRMFKTYIYLGDGECNEGSVWEAAMLAGQLKLSSLTAIIDHNGLQSDGESNQIIDNSNIAERFASFGWDVVSIDGHNVPEIVAAFDQRFQTGKPKAIIARTVKGKGISFMENDNAWHHNRLTRKTYDEALECLGVPATAED